MKLTPSVEGNEIVFCYPELESFEEFECGNIKFKILTGSIDLDFIRGFKDFKNDKGVTWKREKFNPNIAVLKWSQKR